MASSVEEKRKTGAGSLLKDMNILKESQDRSEAKKILNSQLWHACAGPLVSLPEVGSLVYYFPQGHIEQVTSTTPGTTTSHIPNYQNLPPQLMCQVLNVKLHADKETDEIYAQMTLQPVNSEEDVFHIPGSTSSKPTKHPNEFFCKTLTASDTSTHGGFSVPRRAAEKLFPPLDYSIQPPTQEITVRDMHDNSWTFRHIYRGQPKRHLLTTGWSLFVSSRRLKAGDSILFIRDGRSQLLLGVRRANRLQSALQSSILSMESMHIGVLAAAAHAVANRTSFTIFYNPRACSSEFVVPLDKFQKSIYGTHITIGMRFGMLFETEESGKRRYMGTVVGIRDIDPVRWPNSKWRNLQVAWDEAGFSENKTRVSQWEIETPESIFNFPSLSSSLKRPLHSQCLGVETEWENTSRRPFVQGPENQSNDIACSSNLGSEQLIKMVLKPQCISHLGAFSSALPAFVIKGTPVQEETHAQTSNQWMSQDISLQNNLLQNQRTPKNYAYQLQTLDSSLISQLLKVETQLTPKTPIEKSELAPIAASSQLTQLKSSGKFTENTVGNPFNPQNLISQLIALNHQGLNVRAGPLEPKATHPHQANTLPLQMESSDANGPLQNTNSPLLYQSASESVSGILGSSGTPPSGCGKESNSVAYPDVVQEIWEPQLNPERYSFEAEFASCPEQNSTTLQGISSSCTLKDLPDQGSNDQSEVYNDLHFEVRNGRSSTIVDPYASSSVFLGLCSLDDDGFQTPDCLLSNLSSSDDIQSHITTASLADSQSFSLQEFRDNSVGPSLNNVSFDENCLLQEGSWKQVPPPMRTYTKVQKLGSVGRSIDITRYQNYEELKSTIACMFNLEGLLDDTSNSGWKLVYVDYENDILLVGDDPWEEFVNCVRCIRILSPSEVQQMSKDGMQLLKTKM